MNASTKRKRSIFEIILGICLIVAGFLLMDQLAGHFLNVKEVYKSGVVYYVSDNRYQWCTWLTVLGAFLGALGIIKVSNFLSSWSTSVYNSYTSLNRCKLAVYGFFTVCLNLFTLELFSELTELDFAEKNLQREMMDFERYNLYLAFGFGALLLLVIILNSCFSGKIKYTYYLLSVFAIIESILGIVVRTKSVPWIWVVYGVGMVLVGIWLFAMPNRNMPGIAFGNRPERIAENIAFYASSHGLGHIMRLTPVIEYILKTTDCNIVLVCDAKQLEFAKGYFYTQTGIPEEYLDEHLVTVEMKTDFGIAVRPGSLVIDPESVKSGVVSYLSELPELGYQGVQLIDDYKITKVVGDIAPCAFLGASFRRIPSILMLSFTWVEIYQEYLWEDLIRPYREMYQKANKVLRYALCNRVASMSFPNATDVGFVARPINYEHAAEIQSKFEKPIVYFTIGLSNEGIDIAPDVSDLPYTFIVTKGVKLRGDNVIALSENSYDAQDYVAAAKYCIIKSGWTTISECMIAGKPMALLGRDDVAEDRMSIDMLVELRRGIKISVEEIYNPAAILEKLERTEFDTTPQANDFANIAEEILNYH